MTWFVYIVECADGSLYTGIARDVTARIERHNRGVGARYTRSRVPVSLVYSEPAADRSAAQRREYGIRHLPAAEKRALAVSGQAPQSSRGQAVG
jgi:putative endonuclease